jgi:hypothetical protein
MSRQDALQTVSHVPAPVGAPPRLAPPGRRDRPARARAVRRRALWRVAAETALVASVTVMVARATADADARPNETGPARAAVSPASSGSAESDGAQEPVATRPGDPAMLAAIIAQVASGGRPGTFVTKGTRLQRTEDTSPLGIFVQADASRGPDRTVRVPLTMTTDAGPSALLRFRVVRTAPAAAQAATVVEDTARADGDGTMRVVRELTLDAGGYEVVVAAARREDDRTWVATSVKYPLTVPDLWSGDLVVSPVVLGDAAAVAPPAAGSRPFVFGRTALTPAADSRFRQGEDLHVAFRIHSWKAGADAKPDLTVDFVFHHQTQTRLQFFNKTKTQTLSAATLGEGFTREAGGEVAAGLSIPLVSFPPGAFRLAVRVTDKRTKTTRVGDVRFVVVE